MAGADIEFDWDDANIRHLRRHRVTPSEFQEVLLNGPLELDYQNEDEEDRYKSLGVTDSGRVLVAVWTIRASKIRAITAYGASRMLRLVFQRFVKENDDAEA